MEPWVAVLAVVGFVALVVLKWVARRRVLDAIAERNRRSGRKPTAAGAAAVAAFFLGCAVLVHVLDGDDSGRRDLPDWLTIPLFVVGGLWFAGVAVRRWRTDAAGRPSGGGTA